MATVKYYLRDSKNGSMIYVHFNVSTSQKFRTSTGLYIDPKEWNARKAMPKANIATAKRVLITLQELERAILEAYNSTTASGQTIDKDFLKEVVNNFFNKGSKGTGVYFLDFVQMYIDGAHTRKNKKGGTGLSLSSIHNLKNFKIVLERYENKTLKNRLTLKNISNNEINDFIDYQIKDGYSLNSVGVFVSQIKAVCSYIKEKGIELNVNTSTITVPKEKKDAESIITLSFEELDKIKALEGLSPYLDNARKWLLLGCEIGQRASDLLALSESNITEVEGVPAFRVTQKKTGKEIYIPLTQRAKEAIKDGMPRKISFFAFNEYIKEVCRKAGINTPITQKQRRNENAQAGKIEVEKWEVVSSHICRRSFATNYYGKIPTSTLKAITGHSTEEMFLNYIGKTAYNHAKEMIQAFKLLTE